MHDGNVIKTGGRDCQLKGGGNVLGAIWLPRASRPRCSKRSVKLGREIPSSDEIVRLSESYRQLSRRQLWKIQRGRQSEGISLVQEALRLRTFPFFSSDGGHGGFTVLLALTLKTLLCFFESRHSVAHVSPLHIQPSLLTELMCGLV